MSSELCRAQNLRATIQDRLLRHAGKKLQHADKTSEENLKEGVTNLFVAALLVVLEVLMLHVVAAANDERNRVPERVAYTADLAFVRDSLPLRHQRFDFTQRSAVLVSDPDNGTSQPRCPGAALKCCPRCA